MLVPLPAASLDSSQRKLVLNAAPRLRRVTARGGAARSGDLQIAEQTVHPSGPVGAVSLVGEPIGLQDVADLPPGADDLEGDAARGKLTMEIVQHPGACQVDERRGWKAADEQPGVWA